MELSGQESVEGTSISETESELEEEEEHQVEVKMFATDIPSYLNCAICHNVFEVPPSRMSSNRIRGRCGIEGLWTYVLPEVHCEVPALQEGMPHRQVWYRDFASLTNGWRNRKVVKELHPKDAFIPIFIIREQVENLYIRCKYGVTENEKGDFLVVRFLQSE
jgi:hypothetical protein